MIDSSIKETDRPKVMRRLEAFARQLIRLLKFQAECSTRDEDRVLGQPLSCMVVSWSMTAMWETDVYIVCARDGVRVTMTLPAAAKDRDQFLIQDGLGNAARQPIRLKSAKQIFGATAIDWPGGQVTCVFSKEHDAWLVAKLGAPNPVAAEPPP
jgi:hypothetical protein